jgi:hypothetical protein
MLQMSKIAGHEFFAKMRSRRRSLYVMLFASTFPAGAIVVFIPWGRGAEARAANRQREHDPRLRPFRFSKNRRWSTGASRRLSG